MSEDSSEMSNKGKGWFRGWNINPWLAWKETKPGLKAYPQSGTTAHFSFRVWL